MVDTWRLRQKAVGARRPFQSRSAAVNDGFQTAFLSHSHKDRDLALGLQAMLLEAGWRVYLDWQDEKMPDQPNEETAARIVEKINENRWFLMLATPASLKSLWCPWEVGIAHNVKDHDTMYIVMTRDVDGRLHGTEFYHLYRRIALPANCDRLYWARRSDKASHSLEGLNRV